MPDFNPSPPQELQEIYKQSSSPQDFASKIKQSRPGRYDQLSEQQLIGVLDKTYPGVFGFKVADSKSASLIQKGRETAEPPTPSQLWGAVRGTVVPAAGIAASIAMPQTAPIWLQGLGLAGAGGAASVVKQGIDIATDHPEAPKSAGEFAGDVAKEAAIEGGLQATGQFLLPPARMVRSGIKAMQDPTTTSISRLQTRLDLGLTPPEVLQSPWGETLQHIADISLGGLERAKVAQGRGIQNAAKHVDEVVSTLAGGVSEPLQVAQFTQQAVRDVGRNVYKRTGSKAFEDVSRMAGQVQIDMAPAIAEIRNVVQKEFAPLQQIGAKQLGKPTTSTTKIIEDFSQLSPIIGFDQANLLQQHLRKIGQEIGELAPDQAERIASIARDKVMTAIETALQQQAPQALQKWKAARKFWSRGADVFERSAVHKAGLADDPEFIFDLIKDGGESSAKAFKRAIFQYAERLGTTGEKQYAQAAWDQFREMFLRRRVLEDPYRAAISSPEQAKVTIENLRNIRTRLNDIGDGVLDTMFRGDPTGRMVLDNLYLVANAMDRMNVAKSEARGFIYQALGTIGSALGGGLFYGGASGPLGGLAAFQAIPYTLSKMLRSPTLTNLYLNSIDIANHQGASAAEKFLYTATRKAMSQGVPDVVRVGRIWFNWNPDKQQPKTSPEPPTPPAMPLTPNIADDNPWRVRMVQ